MKNVRYILCLCIVLLWVHISNGQYEEKKFNWNMKAYEKFNFPTSYGYMPFRLLKPADYNPAIKYPLVLVLHGKGEGLGQQCSNDYGENFCNILWGGDMHLDSIKKYPSIVVFPQSRGGDWETLQGTLVDFLEFLFKSYSVDMDRVYIHGLSGGGIGVWAMAYKYPALFSAVSPHSAAGDPSKASRLMYNSIWTVSGEIDFIVQAKVAMMIMDEFRYRGKNPYLTGNEVWRDQHWPKVTTTGQPIHSLIYGESHVAWPHLYDSPDWLNWLYSQNKNKIQIVGRTEISLGETTKLGIAPGFDAYEWSNGATTNEIIVKKSGTFRVRYLRKKYFFSGPQEWSAWSDPVKITASAFTNPEANAGNDVVVYWPANTAKLRGFAAGSGVTYTWSKLSGPNASLGALNALDLYAGNLKVGEYKFRFLVTDNKGNTSSDDVNLYVVDPNAQKKITGVTLINADNGTDIRKVKNGDVINLGTIPTKNINFRVDTDPMIAFGSELIMSYDGEQKKDTNYPYAVMGDKYCNYEKGKLTSGFHFLYATLATNNQTSSAVSIAFTVIGSSSFKMQEQDIDAEHEEISIYPNPFTNSLNVDFKELQENLSLVVYDQMGSVRYEYDSSNNGLINSLNLQGLPSGIYRIRVNSSKFNNKSYTIVKR